MDKSPLAEFLSTFDDIKKKERSRQEKRDQIKEIKRKALDPIRNLLNDFKTYGVIVSGGQRFVWYEKESSPTWQPGVSLCFDNPAEVEIAVPNDRSAEGVVVVRVASGHKDEAMLNRRFDSMEMACRAIAKFIGANTEAMEHDPRKRAEE